MKQKIYLIIGVLFCIPLVLFSQEKPSSLEQNCLFVDDVYIDTCPKYRKQMQWINTMLYGVRNKQEQASESQQDHIFAINKFLIQLQTIKKWLFSQKQLTPQNIFLLDYMNYLTNLYKWEVQANSKIKWAIKELFTKTYFNTIQQGLVVHDVSLYGEMKAWLYDTKLTIEVSIRNFDSKAHTDIEDVYCFATVANKDYVYPLGMQWELIKANSITNVVWTLDIWEENTLLDFPWQKKLYCMIVFTEQNQEKTSSFFPFSFTVS